MRLVILTAGLALTASVGPLSAVQVPIGPPRSVHGCLRPDVAKNAQLVKDAIASKSATDPVEVLRPVAGCTYYRITMVSKLTIEDTEVAGVTSTISGKGSITFGLAPDDAMAGYDFTSGVQDLTAPIYWDRGSALITKPDCIVTTVELPYTLFAFWLGVTSSGTPKVGVRVSPADQDLHSIATRCKDPVGKWHDLPPGKEAIFAPAWIKLHGEGKTAVAPSADQQAISKFTDDVVKAGPKPGSKIKPSKAYSTPALPTVSSPTGALDPAKLQAMQDYLAKNPNATPAEMMKMMEGVVPNLDQQLAAAEDNFMFTAPGDCAAVNPTRTVCTLAGPPVTTDRTGYGTIKRLTERTTITIEKVAPPPGSP
jgi:hypothetical protein